MIHPQTEELKKNYSPDGSELRTYQLALLDILIDIDSLCRLNNINYSLAAGTLMGALRHEGFIPWDDDADIMMTRHEFCKLINLHDDKGFFTDSLRIEYTVRPVFVKNGKIIDIFVEDNCPDSSFYAFVKKTCARIVGLGLKCKRKVILHNVFSPIKPWIVLIPLFLPFKLEYLHKLLYKISIWNNNKYCKFKSCYNDSIRDIRHKYPSIMFDEYIDVLFEGHYFRSVKDYEMHLCELYGDWRQIPPQNKRVWLSRVHSDVKIKRK